MNKIFQTRLFILLFILNSIIYSSHACAADYEPLPGTIFTLIKALTIPDKATSVYIQNKIATRDERLIDQYYANCLFEQHDLAKGEKVIPPDKFIVTKTMLSREYSAVNSFKFITLFYLTSHSNKKEYTLECQHWGELYDNYLTREQIQETLKVYFVINDQ